ncbi:AAA family ATPase [Shewanella algae]|uniref:AAA family ATPase n=1 Tax=Shewanella algae TaxID=38313 RepID=UPI0031F57979
MEKYIQKIEGEIPNTHKVVEVILNGKNLIITGQNGSGKTSFLKELYKKTEILIVQKKKADLPQLKEQYENNLRLWKENTVKGTTQYDQFKRYVENAKNALDAVVLGLQIDIPDNVNFSSSYDDRVAVVRLFEASRTANISHAETAKGLETERKQQEQQNQSSNKNLGNNLEQHLVNLKNRRSLALSEDSDLELAGKIQNWFEHFESTLKTLMEDSSTCLEFNSDTLKFTIHQDSKPPYTFQSLSSGYLAIFDIYADLLMRTEYFKVTPEQLKGTVFIDEIDAHLHVSLQRLILPFLYESFPSIQFIVTTHSPFVLMSVDDTIIYDIGRNAQIDENLSFYSYSSVMEGILNTKPTSMLLDGVISEISEIANSKEINYDRLTRLVKKVEPLADKLDSREKSFYLLGVNALLDMEGK